eukprot:gb/GEZN01003029.1/.p1 GENE.gb/GEZN01003029.1/~~gb/GEZN01003029.1/.p1  ORF type:complete len:627 (-),score=80.85 gb/GEZN01003029.1/:331-2211(-)
MSLKQQKAAEARPCKVSDKKWSTRSGKKWLYEILFSNGKSKWMTEKEAKPLADNLSTLLEEYEERERVRLQLAKPQQENWEVERILDEKRGKDNKMNYLVKWSNWGHRYNSWQREDDFTGLDHLLADFRERMAVAKQEARALAKGKRLEAISASANRIAPALADALQQSEQLSPEEYRLKQLVTRKAGLLESDSQGETWAVQKIVGHTRENTKPRYLVKWLHWHEDFNSWVKKNDFAKNAFPLLFQTFESDPKLKQCGRCSMRVLGEGLMGSHCLQAHGTERNEFPCSFLNCKELLDSAEAKDQHYEEHFRLQTCPAQACNAEYRNSADYDDHLKTHIFCEICPLDFQSDAQRVAHMDKIHPLLWLCPDKSCGQSFSSSKTFSDHIVQNHERNQKNKEDAFDFKNYEPQRLSNLNGKMTFLDARTEKLMRRWTMQGVCRAPYVRADHIIPIVVKYVDEFKQFGAFAARDIKQGEWIGIYGGMVVSNKWLRENHAENSVYLFKATEELVIDGTHHGNITRFINHNDDGLPNVKTSLVNYCGVRIAALHASWDIKEGEELLINYSAGDHDKNLNCNPKSSARKSAAKRKGASQNSGGKRNKVSDIEKSTPTKVRLFPISKSAKRAEVN